MQKPKILITGATGQAGQKTINFLQNSDAIEIVAAVRSDKKAQPFHDQGIATVLLDFDELIRLRSNAPDLPTVMSVD